MDTAYDLRFRQTVLVINAKIKSAISVNFSRGQLLHFLADYGKIPLPVNGSNFQSQNQERRKHKDG
jgi:hypothetical protein